MKVVITGATGTIGQALTAALARRGDSVVALSRDAERGRKAAPAGVEVHTWAQPTKTPPPAEALAGADGVVHLLGAPVDQRWTAEAKRAIRDSRELGTRMLVAGLRGLGDGERPRVLISQSATGFYGPRGAEQVDEQAQPGSDFLAGVVIAWESEAEKAAPLTRVVRTRTGVVLSRAGGALAKMLPAFRLGLGGPVAGGHQYMPWVHLDDVVGALMFSLDSGAASGAVNVTAPNPVTNAEFSRALGRVLGRPAVLPVPGFALRALFGEMAEVVTSGQRAIPRRLQELGYGFHQPDVEPALANVLAG
ncbi:MAG: TIGR01777 family oxidoreductase [Solirubrobacterales bacterium]|nr:TIGR01777 family oxidoreductase [Solirubrobacterales bacterium]